MGIIANAIGEGLGSAMGHIGAGIMARESRSEEIAGKYALEREKLAQDFQIRMQQLADRRETDKMRWGGEDGASRKSGRGGGAMSATDLVSEIMGGNPEIFGIQRDMPKQEQFTKEEITSATRTPVVDDAGGEYSDAVSRKTARLDTTTEKVADRESFEKAKEGIVEKNIRNTTRIANPDKYDDLAKGDAQAIMNKLVAAAASEEDPEKRDKLIVDANKISVAAGGKERYKVSGNTVVDVATGEQDTTKVGESIAEKNKRAPVGKGGGSSNDDKNAHKLITSLDIDKRDTETAIAKARKALEGASKEDRPGIRASIAAKEDRLGEIEKKLTAAREQITKPSTSAAPSQAAAAPTKGSQASPKIESIKGAPAGSKIGSMVDGKGWQVLDSKGKVIGYARN